MEYFDELVERVILVGVQVNDGEDTEESLDELAELAHTAGAIPVGRIIQNREAVHPGTYIGKGKIDEVRALMLATDATGVICDDELSSAQLHNLERELECKVMDRAPFLSWTFLRGEPPPARARSRWSWRSFGTGQPVWWAFGIRCPGLAEASERGALVRKSWRQTVV